ncbi:hypothetical protein B0H13DRAFT_1901434 [Mycena leptocephala]|nr:hypothetical protein B0H13DRAFT_1901434 [Mycena leptocephala]
MAANNKASIFRIISFTLAGGDILQTIPDTWNLYGRSWKNHSLSPVCFFYACARYARGDGGPDLDIYSASQLDEPGAVSDENSRTFAISGRSALVYYGLGSILLLGFPIQAFGIVYHRLPETKGVRAKKVWFEERADILDLYLFRESVKERCSYRASYYSAHMGYDVIACATGAFYLISSSRVQGSFNMSGFVRRVLRNGLLYTLVVFLANLWVVLEFEDVLKTGVGATLPLAIVLIASDPQHLSPRIRSFRKHRGVISSRASGHKEFAEKYTSGSKVPTNVHARQPARPRAAVWTGFGGRIRSSDKFWIVLDRGWMQFGRGRVEVEAMDILRDTMKTPPSQQVENQLGVLRNVRFYVAKNNMSPDGCKAAARSNSKMDHEIERCPIAKVY